MSMISCPHCQRQSPDDASFCPYCGQLITVPGEQAVEESVHSTTTTDNDGIEAIPILASEIEKEQPLLISQEETATLTSQDEPKKEDAPSTNMGEEETVFNLSDVQQEEEKTVLAQPLPPAQDDERAVLAQSMRSYDATPARSYDEIEIENPYEAPIYYEDPQPLYYEDPQPLLLPDDPIENPYETPMFYQSTQAAAPPATPQPVGVPGVPALPIELGQYAATPDQPALASTGLQATQPSPYTPPVPPVPQKPLWLRRPILTGSIILLLIIIIAGTVLQFRQGNPIKSITNYFQPKTMIAVTDTNLYAFNADDGKQLWQKPISTAGESATQENILLEDGVLYWVGKTVSALDMRTGEVKWSVPGVIAGDFPLLHLYEDILYMAGDKQIAAYNAGNGTLLWSRTVDDADGFIGYLSFQGQNICFKVSNKLYVLDAKIGTTKLTHDLTRDAPQGNAQGFWSSLILPLGEKYIVLNWTDLLANKGSVVALDIESGNMVWRLDGNDHLFYLPDSDITKKRNDKFYMYERKGERDFTFSAYDVRGASLWQKSIGDGTVNIQGDQVYMAGSKELKKWNIQDGNQVWSATSPGVQNSDYHSSSVGGSTLTVNVGKDVFGYDINTAGQKWKVPETSLVDIGPNQTFRMWTYKSHILFSVSEPKNEFADKYLGKLGIIHPDTGKARWKADLSGELLYLAAN